MSIIEQTLNYEFKNKDLLKEALTHRSYSSEKGLNYDNQRLEFLGDSVLEIILTEYLYLRYPSAPEGHLTKMRSALVQQNALANLAEKLELQQHIVMGKGEIDSGGNHRDSTLSDAFEALIGAFYLDAGIEEVKNFLLPLIEKNYPAPSDMLLSINPKGALQEYTQKHLGAAPYYKTVEISGPDHEPLYKVTVSVKNKIIGQGEASKRKTAESEAARQGLIFIEKNNGNIDQI